jgi:hypothetical protein
MYRLNTFLFKAQQVVVLYSDAIAAIVTGVL